MPDIRKLLENGTQFYPETLDSAVYDDNGEAIATKLSALGSNIIQAMRVFALYLDEVSSTSTITSPEWMSAITDYDGKILAGEKTDGTIYIAKI